MAETLATNPRVFETTEILISNMSLPLRLNALGTPEQHTAYVRAIGADGIEFMPLGFGRFTSRLLGCASVVERASAVSGIEPTPELREADLIAASLIRSTHSSFHDGSNPKNPITHLVPSWKRSLAQMARIQQIAGPQSAVLYPQFGGKPITYTSENAPFTARTFQPTPAEWRRFGLTEHSSADKIRAAIGSQGFDGSTWDVFHCEIGEEDKLFRNSTALAARLAASGITIAVHASLNRTDFRAASPEKREASKKARNAFVKSPEAALRTREGAMLQAIIEASRLPDGHTTLKHIVLEDGPFRTDRHLKEKHRAILETLQTLAMASSVQNSIMTRNQPN
jgi:hypothetical protein